MWSGPTPADKDDATCRFESRRSRSGNFPGYGKLPFFIRFSAQSVPRAPDNYS